MTRTILLACLVLCTAPLGVADAQVQPDFTLLRNAPPLQGPSTAFVCIEHKGGWAARIRLERRRANGAWELVTEGAGGAVQGCREFRGFAEAMVTVEAARGSGFAGVCRRQFPLTSPQSTFTTTGFAANPGCELRNGVDTTSNGVGSMLNGIAGSVIGR